MLPSHLHQPLVGIIGHGHLSLQGAVVDMLVDAGQLDLRDGGRGLGEGWENGQGRKEGGEGFGREESVGHTLILYESYTLTHTWYCPDSATDSL